MKLQEDWMSTGQAILRGIFCQFILVRNSEKALVTPYKDQSEKDEVIPSADQISYADGGNILLINVR